MFRVLRFVLLVCTTRSQDENCESSLLQVPGSDAWLSATLAAANDWPSGGHLATIAELHQINTGSVDFTIFSAVPVFGPEENYIALLTERHDDIWLRNPDLHWPEKLTRGISCSGHDRSHLTEAKFKGSVVICDWPREEQDKKNFQVSLEDANGTILASIVASHDQKLLE